MRASVPRLVARFGPTALADVHRVLALPPDKPLPLSAPLCPRSPSPSPSPPLSPSLASRLSVLSSLSLISSLSLQPARRTSLAASHLHLPEASSLASVICTVGRTTAPPPTISTTHCEESDITLRASDGARLADAARTQYESHPFKRKDARWSAGCRG